MPRPLTGDETPTVVAAFCRLGGTRGISIKLFPGWRLPPDVLAGGSKLMPFETLRRPSGAAWNETSKGDEGCETRLGEEFAWLNPDGDCGRWDALALDNVRWICGFVGVGSTGLPSSTGLGDARLLLGPPGLTTGCCLFCAAKASARSF